MAANEVKPPFPVFHDTNGLALENGYVYIGSAGLDAELNPITAYWDSEFTITASQPIRTINGYYSKNGSAGRLFVRDSLYSITVRNKNSVLIYSSVTLDTTAQSYVINVKDFGAIGNGVTDDTAAIQAAIDSLDTAVISQTGGVIYFPMGSYIISTPIEIENSHASGLASITLRGDGKNNTKLTCASGFTGAQAVLMSEPSFCMLEDIGVNGNNNVADGIYINDGSHIQLDRVLLTNLTGKGFKIRNVFDCVLAACGTDFVDDASFDFESSAALDAAAAVNGIQCVLRDCSSKNTGATYGSVYTNQVDSGSIDVKVVRLVEESIGGTVSISSNTNVLDHVVKIENCTLLGKTNAVSAHHIDSQVIRVNVAVDGSQIPVFKLESVFGDEVAKYGGLIVISASNGQISDSLSDFFATYVLLVIDDSPGVLEIKKYGDITGGASNHPSFSWALDQTNNHLEATPIGSTLGSFYFQANQVGTIKLSNV